VPVCVPACLPASVCFKSQQLKPTGHRRRRRFTEERERYLTLEESTKLAALQQDRIISFSEPEEQDSKKTQEQKNEK